MAPTPITAPELPDLVITAFAYSSVTVANTGSAPAGPFRLRAGSAVVEFTGLAPGESQARTLRGLSCDQTYTAVVDDTDQVAESDEANNTADSTFVAC